MARRRSSKTLVFTSLAVGMVLLSTISGVASAAPTAPQSHDVHGTVQAHRVANLHTTVGSVDVMTERADGSTAIQRHVRAGALTAPAGVSPDALLFNYGVNFVDVLSGRTMTSSTGTFCNNFESTYVQRPDKDAHIGIQLWDGPIAVGINVSYPLDGTIHGYCWRGFNPAITYHFRYTKNNDGYDVQGRGNVTNSG